MPVLTMVDILGIQDYIFTSNRLKDIAGASHQLKTIFDVLPGPPPQNVLLKDGGNLIVEFSNEMEAKNFAENFSSIIIRNIPGLEVIISHKSYITNGLSQALKEIIMENGRDKTRRLPNIPLFGLGINEICQETGLPAHKIIIENEQVEFINEGIFKRREVLAEIKQGKRRDPWQGYLSQKFPGNKIAAFPLEIDDLGRSFGEMSMVAVVHLDANSLGENLNKFMQRCQAQNLKDEEFAQKYKEVSNNLKTAGENALNSMMELICNNIDYDEENDRYFLKMLDPKGFELKSDSYSFFLPMRPVVLGGDDLTFICDARIAFDLTATALRSLETIIIDGLENITAGAGIAIGRYHTPFFCLNDKAYELAENSKIKSERKRSSLDWLMDINTASPSLQFIRNREYTYQGKSLTQKPYLLGNDEGEWNWLSYKILMRMQDDESWGKARNQLKKLMPLFRRALHEPLLKKLEQANLNLEKQHGTYNYLLDALEILDLYIPLVPQKQEDKLNETTTTSIN